MTKKIKSFLTLISLIFILTLPYFAFAGDPAAIGKLEKVGTDGGYEAVKETTFAEILGKSVGVFLSLLGVIFIILIIYAGYNWMTAAGNEEKVTKAQDTIKRAIIGLIIIVSAYAITYFVFKYLPFTGGSGMGQAV